MCIRDRYHLADIPASMAAQAKEWRDKLFEQLADVDDVIAEKYLEGKDISEEEIVAALRKGTIALKLVPTFCGSSFKNKGVQFLLDSVVDFLPSPIDIPPVKGKDPADETKEDVYKRQRVHHDAEEAELGPPEGCQGPPRQRL